MSTPPVIALWLDSADPGLLEDLLAAGALPHLARLRAEGAYGRLHSIRFGVTEVSYAMLGTGCWPSTLGYWQQCDFDPATYSSRLAGLGHFDRHRPFYALGSNYRVVLFDVPQMPLRDDAHGLQLASWGAHAAHVPRASRPEELLAEILARHGLPPMERQSGYEPDDADSLRGIHRALLEGLARREAVLVDLWRRAGGHRWDLFFAAVAETHTAGHALWPHPALRAALDAVGGERLLTEVYSRADALVGRLVGEAGPDAQVAIFSVEGVRGNHMDNGSMLFLPELLMRDAFPGEPVFDFDAPPAHEPPPAGLAGWYLHVWRHRVRPGPLGSWLRRHLAPARAAAWEARLGLGVSPYPGPPAEERYLPATWFEPYFPYMKAFALPTFSDGFVRLNVRGRERHGRVPPREYGRVSDEITALLHGLVDEHGRAVVEEVIRTRRHAGEDGPGVPPADLAVRWSPHCGREVRSPRLGRLGPTLPPRLGNHTAHGFLLARGPGFAPGSTLPDARVVDLAPTLLAMVGAPAPAMDGRSLLDVTPAPAPSRPGVLLQDPNQPEPRPARLAMVLCVRNEEDFLLANLLYHRALGVERAYVYLDRCTDRSVELASRLAGVRLIEAAPAERARFEYVGDFQAACMTHALGLARAEGFAWLLAVDADEFASGVDRREAPAAGDALAASAAWWLTCRPSPSRSCSRPRNASPPIWGSRRRFGASATSRPSPCLARFTIR